ncbi:MAG TPA: hypothetical protein VNF46_04580 [Gammaproteobacteria bacterium]|nr:hypothetical protein [Gammaproteobacteria bacterium]
MAEGERIDLPRTLVNQLLHAAQLRPSQIHWGLISGRDGNPEHCHALNRSPQAAMHTVHALRETLAQDREQVWGLYCSGPGEISAPSPSELARLSVARFLGISLGTKGVLQLRGWRVVGASFREMEVTIRET